MMIQYSIGVLIVLQIYAVGGILYPKATSTREIISLDGLWKFSLDVNSNFDTAASLSGSENDKDIQFMPVPSSYNDIVTSGAVRDHVGQVKYERTFWLPKSWQSKDSIVWIRFGSVCYSAEVILNGQVVLKHQVGHLPFEAQITNYLLKEGINVITVIVDNTLTDFTIPQGNVETLPGGRKKQTYSFDFFNYAGIDRSVVLYRTPTTYISDIDIKTISIGATDAVVEYNVKVDGNQEYDCKIIVLDKKEQYTAEKNTTKGSFIIAFPRLWWPYLMDKDPGYLYTLKVEIFKKGSMEVVDTYEQSFGIRKIAWTNTTFTINNKPIYIRGVGKHEDSDIRGKGYDLPMVLRDHNLLKWMGVNTYRTSHYPYAEEIMDLADELGIMIIDEVPAVNIEKFGNDLLENHKRTLSELYNRDKNRPSVIMWSIANEPRTQHPESADYFNHIAAHIKNFDQSRPITIPNNQLADADHAGQYLDILSANIYIGWYSRTGDLDAVKSEITKVLEDWHKKHNKPVLVTEYGADTIEGLHSLPSVAWSEEYQTEFSSVYFEVFDELRKKGWLIGEMVWNFADFKTSQKTIRVGGNRKGVLTRQRQPKASAHILRKRYWELAQELSQITPPSDLEPRTIKTPARIEL